MAPAPGGSLIRLLAILSAVFVLAVPAVADAHSYVLAIRHGSAATRTLTRGCTASGHDELTIRCSSSSDSALLRYRFVVPTNAGPVYWHVHFGWFTRRVQIQKTSSGKVVTISVRAAGVVRFQVDLVVIGYYRH
jgi:hypothetical protein